MSDSRRAGDPRDGLAARCEQLEREIDRLRSLLDQHGIAIPAAPTKPNPRPAPSSLRTPEKARTVASATRPGRSVTGRRTMPQSPMIVSASTRRQERISRSTTTPFTPIFPASKLSACIRCCSMTLAGSLQRISTRRPGRKTPRRFGKTCNTLGVPASVECSRSRPSMGPSPKHGFPILRKAIGWNAWYAIHSTCGSLQPAALCEPGENGI